MDTVAFWVHQIQTWFSDAFDWWWALDGDHKQKWLQALAGPTVTAIGFCFIVIQIRIAARTARETQKWKKGEFLAEQAKDFHEDETIELVTLMLDWDFRLVRFYTKEEKEGAVDVLSAQDGYSLQTALNDEFADQKYRNPERHVVLTLALKSHHERDQFTTLEATARDKIDWFLFRLGQFQQMIESKLFTYKECEVHLRYVLDLACGRKNHTSLALDEALATYIKEYDFKEAEKLLNLRRRRTREVAKAKRTVKDAADQPNDEKS